jgi:hypothetical protein
MLQYKNILFACIMWENLHVTIIGISVQVYDHMKIEIFHQDQVDQVKVIKFSYNLAVVIPRSVYYDKFVGIVV